MSDLRSYRSFADPAQARELMLLLEEHHIISHVVEVKSSLDANFGGSELIKTYEVKIQPDDFEKVNEILEQKAGDLISNVDRDHYLFGFTNEELYEVLVKSDEWSEFDYKLAISILNERGENANEYFIASLKKERLEDLSQPEESQMFWIFIGYMFSLLGGLFGIFIGWYIWSSKKTLPNGSLIHSYNADDRKHGKIILILGLIIFPIAFIYKMNSLL